MLVCESRRRRSDCDIISLVVGLMHHNDCDIISLLVGLIRILLIFGVLLVRHEVKKILPSSLWRR